MTGFLTRTLGEICDEVGGIIRTGPFGSQLHQSDYKTEGLPVIMPKDIIDGKVVAHDIARIGTEDEIRLKAHKLKTGDIVYGRRGDIGRRSLITEREDGWLCGTGSLRISLGNKVLDPVFLFYYLGDPYVIAKIQKQAVGATMPNLNSTIVRNIEISYPPLPTQRKIAAVLSAYDDLIENNTRRIRILEQMAQAVYREWFVHFRFPGHEGVKMVDGVPEGWEMVKVGDVATLFRGRSYSSDDLTEEGGLPFLNLKCFERDGGFKHNGIKRYKGIFKDTQTSRPGDIIIAVTDMTQERRIVARTARVPDIGEDKYVMSMDVIKLTPKSAIHNAYLYAMLRFSNFPDEVKQHANGVNVLHLNPERITGFQFLLPSQHFREQFGNFAESIYIQCDVLMNINDNLRRTRDLLLPRLVNGEVEV